ncbi:MAG TPA: amidase [Armatimonadota bacterium]
MGQDPESSADIPAFDLEEATVNDLQAAMAAGRLTSRAITAKYLERIDALDRRGPTLRYVIETNPDALSIAEELDAERKAKGPRGPLHGLPVLVKDNIDTADRMTTTAGSLALEGHIAARDAFLVARLRAAGAVILGKANLSEWSNFRSGRSSSGWSARGGQARNPYALDRSPSGSSSGPAGAVSANLCPVAVGTETNGSIVSPSSCCGVVGIKPTVGLVSRAGIIPISSSLDTAGPIARTVADAAALLGAMTGVDSDDDATIASRDRVGTDYTKCLKADGLKGARIGVWRAGGFDPKVLPILESAVAAIRSAGAAVIDAVEVPTYGKLGDPLSHVLRYEFKATLNAYLRALGPDARVRTLEDVIAFNEKHRDREMPFFGQEIFLEAQERRGLDSPTYLRSRDEARRLAREEGLHAALDTQGLDALVALTNGPAGLTDLVNGDRGTGGTSTLCAVAGCPSITVPAGDVFGLPVGISFMGRAFDEATLVRLAYAFEQLTHARKPPRFLPTLDLPL